MKRLVVRWNDQFVNINAARIEERDGMVYAFDNAGLVGVFDLGAVDMIYLSGGGE